MDRVDLEKMLAARDRRVDIQNKMLEGCGDEECLVCLTLNIAGDIKRTPMTRMLFDGGVREFERLGFDVISHLETDDITGSEGFWLVREDAAVVKKQLEAVEDAFPAARLFDFDVLAADGHKLSRNESRRCLICDRPAAECARSRAHGLDAIKSATQDLLKDYCARVLSDEAYEALLSEAYATPKPGLVDRNNNGAHRDMDLAMLERSAAALRPYFRDAAMLGMEDCSMAELRARGLDAEREMFAATGGVNTHKGMIYSMGLLIAGMGRAIKESSELSTEGYTNSVENAAAGVTGDTGRSAQEPLSLKDRAVSYAAGLASEDAEQMLAAARANPSTNGAAVLRNYGVTGATGHAAGGFPDALYTAGRLAYYINEESLSDEEAGALALCDSMARLEDTNLLHRGGRAGMDFAMSGAAEISALPAGERTAALRELDREMIRRNLSPGGSADMLALAFLLNRWNKR